MRKDHDERLLSAALDWLDMEGEIATIKLPQHGPYAHVHQPTAEGIKRAVWTLHRLLWEEWARQEAGKHTVPDAYIPEETMLQAVQAVLDIITPASLRHKEEAPPGGDGKEV